jgi:spore germination cell wall hydrolase CwlJ-like protein
VKKVTKIFALVMSLIILSSSKSYATPTKHHPKPATPIVSNYVKSVDCTSLAIYTEAGNQSLTGKELVGVTVTNRLAKLKKTKPNANACDIIMAPEQYKGVGHNSHMRGLVHNIRKGKQWKHKLRLSKAEQQAYDNSRKAASDALNKRTKMVKKNSKAEFFATPSAARKQGWYNNRKMQYLGQIGGHVTFASR